MINIERVFQIVANIAIALIFTAVYAVVFQFVFNLTVAGLFGTQLTFLQSFGVLLLSEIALKR